MRCLGDEDSDAQIQKQDTIEELDGQLSQSDPEEQKLMKSVLQGEQGKHDGQVMEDAINNNLGAFMPDMMFSKITQNYKQAKQIYGERMLRELSGYDGDFVDKNAKVPEFQKQLKSNIGQRIKDLKNKGLLNEEGRITDKGAKLASLVMYTEELDKLDAKGMLGKKEHKKNSMYGEKQESWPYKKRDRYVDIDVQKTAKIAIKRGHKKILPEDLRISERSAEGHIEIIYAIDASGSMKGKKIERSKKAGVALAYNAIENNDKVGLIVFGTDVKAEVEPCSDFHSIIRALGSIQASKETNFGKTIEKAVSLFSEDDLTKHLVFITDGMPTVGEFPEQDTLDAILAAKEAGITVSMIGVELDPDAAHFLRKAAELGGGHFQSVANSADLDIIVLEEYNAM